MATDNTRRPSPMDRFLRAYDKMRLPCEPDLPASSEGAEVRAADEQPVDLMDPHLMSLLKSRQPMAPDPAPEDEADAPTACKHDALANLAGGPPHKLKPACRPEEDTMRRFLAHVAEGGAPLPLKPRRRRQAPAVTAPGAPPRRRPRG